MSMRRTLLGMLTPSSNTVLEPVTTAMLAGLPDVTAHFGRFRVTEIALNAQALGQFQTAPMLTAAGLLADAKLDTICWNGTSAGWLGFQTDEQLATEIEAQTGIPACSSVLARALLHLLQEIIPVDRHTFAKDLVHQLDLIKIGTKMIEQKRIQNLAQ